MYDTCEEISGEEEIDSTVDDVSSVHTDCATDGDFSDHEAPAGDDETTQVIVTITAKFLICSHL